MYTSEIMTKNMLDIYLEGEQLVLSRVIQIACRKGWPSNVTETIKVFVENKQPSVMSSLDVNRNIF